MVWRHFNGRRALDRSGRVRFSIDCSITDAPRCDYRGNRRIEQPAILAGSGFDVGSDKHWLSASCGQPRHALTFCRLAISRVVAFESAISRASNVFKGGIFACAFAAAVATAGVCTGANASAGVEIVFRDNEPDAACAGDQSEAY